jgi:HEAT repeat protein
VIQALLLLSLWAQDDAAVTEALAKFKADYKGPVAAVRAAAVAQLSRTPHETTFRRMVPLLTGEVKEVRLAAIAGLGGFTAHKKQVIPALLNTLSASAKEPDVAAAVFVSLGKLKDETALPTITARFRKEHITIAKAAVASAGAIGSWECLTALNEFSKDLQKWLKAGSGGGYYDDAGVGEAAAQTARLQALQAELVKAFQTASKEEWTTLSEWEVWYARRKNNPALRK